MVVNDPIADMLTRIRNAQVAKHDQRNAAQQPTPRSPLRRSSLNEGYIKSYETDRRWTDTRAASRSP